MPTATPIATPVADAIGTDARTETATPFARDPRPLVAFDWSVRAVHATTDGATVTVHATVTDLLATLDGPHKLVAEATVESFDPARRAAVLDAIRAGGHELYVFRPLRTGRRRNVTAVAKTDANDARVIWAIAARTNEYLAVAADPHPEWVARREALRDQYLQIRNGGTKAELVAAAREILGRYADLDEDTRAVLGNGTAYSPTLLAVTYFTAQHARSRREFEAFLGLRASGYPTLLRSELHHHAYRHAAKRGVAWTQFRRVLRATFQQLRPAAAATP